MMKMLITMRMVRIKDLHKVTQYDENADHDDHDEDHDEDPDENHDEVPDEDHDENPDENHD